MSESIADRSTPHATLRVGADRPTPADLARSIRRWARELGFTEVAFCDATPPEEHAAQAQQTEARLTHWLDEGYHGTMEYMARHGLRRARPNELVPGAMTIVSVRMDYLPDGSPEAAASNAAASDAAACDRPGDPPDAFRPDSGRRNADELAIDSADDVADRTRRTVDWIDASWAVLHDPSRANVSRYAHGRDYHKVLRGRLQRLADRIAEAVGPFGHRVFTDSAPVMEVDVARRAGLGWRGKHTLLLSRSGGSMFFLGELFIDFALPADAPVTDHCGTCTRCIDVCPTRAIVAPHVLDARRCISYLTIEHAGPIPEEFRPALGNRIYGCDDCQLVCPWNRFARRSPLPDFEVRSIADRTLVEVFAWTEADFLRHTEGSAIRRIGHERWSRNVAVALGNALAAAIGARDRAAIEAALAARIDDPSNLVREHVRWALAAGSGALGALGATSR